MRFFKSFILTAICTFSTSLNAQKFDIDTIQYQGNDKKMINLVILGDGYTKDELKYFKEDASNFTTYFFKTEPFGNYSNYFNVFAINTISKDSGVKHAKNATDCPKDHKLDLEKLPIRFNKFMRDDYMPKSDPSTIFGSTFDSYGMHRLVVPQNVSKIKEVLASHIPNYTQVVILVNSPYYGGSGGEFATSTVNFKSNDIAVHEIGHSFGQLGDEYWAGNQYANEKLNFTNKPTDVPWKKWIGTNGIGIYAYGDKGSASNWYRPHEYCKMQYLVAPFCSVCQEVFVETIHQKTNPILSFKPKNEKPISSDSIKLFSVKLAKPSPNTLKVEWFLNGKKVALNKDSIYINKGDYQKGLNNVRVEIRDTTALVRTDDHHSHVYTENWNVNHINEVGLQKPVITWSKQLETCYNSNQVITVKNPQSGVVYRWYDDINSKNVIAETSNFLTPVLKKNTTYYVEAFSNGKSSERVGVDIKLFEEIKNDSKISKNEKNNILTISVKEGKSDLISYRWFDEDLKPMYKSNSENAHKFSRILETSKTIEIPKSKNLKFIYLQKVDKNTTCTSELKKIEL